MRPLVTVAAGREPELIALAERHGVPLTPLGTTGGTSLAIADQFDIPLSELRDAWSRTLPDALA